MSLTGVTDYRCRQGERCLCPDHIPHRLRQERKSIVARKQHEAAWYDREEDFLEVVFEQKEGYFHETAHDQVMEKVDKDGSIIGFHGLRVSRLTRPLDVELAATDGGR